MRHLSVRRSSVSRLAAIACLTTVLLVAQAQVSPAFPFPFSLNQPSVNSISDHSHSGHSHSGHSGSETRPQLPRSVERRVRRAIADESGVPVARLRIIAATRETWRDGCLGLGGAAELCTMALVPGWRVTVTNDAQTWIYRTDNTGRSLRQESQTGSSTLPQSVSDRVLAAAAQESGIPVEQLQIASAEAKTWDGCLGIEADAVCPQVVIPGWRVVVAGNGRSWVYHTNDDGSQVRLNRFASARLEGVRFLSDRATPLQNQVLFRSIASGGIAGYTYETVLLKSGQVTRSLLRAHQETFSPHRHQVSESQVQQFETVLQKIRAFDRLSYSPAQPIPDAITVTLSSHTGTTQYVDAVAEQLPPDLQTIVKAWGAIAGESLNRVEVMRVGADGEVFEAIDSDQG